MCCATSHNATSVAMCLANRGREGADHWAARAGTVCAWDRLAMRCRTSTLLNLSVVVVTALTVAACAGESEPTTNTEDARAGWRSTQVALGEAGIEAGWTISGTVDENGTSGMVTGLVTCPDGGSMDLHVQGVVDDTQTTGSVSIDFDGCEVDGVIIDGTLDYAGSVTDDEVSASIQGVLTWSGAAQGDCAIDLSASVSKDGASVSGNDTGGSMCGHDFADVFGG